ncbi:hypothetical protein [Chlorogloea sp. CCALA 695]|uniref:hypothetical protein n=1 Tax=Chlorogloea sp. CCALA 695 TaxID=2107693 RepID=UPI00130486DE|nr:hypothetical protein [Chlorogloea sp. CCALA 695]
MLNLPFLMQSLLSVAVVAFCMSQLAGNKTPDQTYWILLSSTLAYWFPSPTQPARKP